MDIIEIGNRRDLRIFIRFPKELYKDCPHYVPPLDDGEFRSLTQHPALAFCDLKLWLAYRDGQVAGRIAGIINRKCNRIKNQKRIRFSWFDTINDLEVAHALIRKVEEWGRSQQLTEICGPSRFSNMEKQSMLVEGFDHTPMVGSDYNYAYYPALLEQIGFQKEVDYVQYKVRVAEVPERIKRLSGILEAKHDIHLRPIADKNELKKYAHELFEVLNQSYTEIFNFIPLNEDEINWAIDDNFQVADTQLASFLEDRNGKMVGFAFCLPSLSEAFRKAKGKLFPLGWYHINKALKNNKFVDMYLTGVLPEYKNSGIHVIYHNKLNETFLQHGFEYAFTSQQLENNTAARIWEKYDAEPYFRRRCFIKKID